MVYMITYDLYGANDEHYQTLLSAIEDCAIDGCSYWHSLYIIRSRWRLDEITEYLKSNVTVNVNLLVIEVTNQYNGIFTDQEEIDTIESLFD